MAAITLGQRTFTPVIPSPTSPKPQTPPTPQAQKIPFAERCKLQLDPKEIEGYQKAADVFQSKAKCWSRVASAIPYVFGTVAVITFVTTGVFFPVHLPLLGVVIFLSMWQVDEARQRTLLMAQDEREKAQEPQEMADQLKAIKKEYDALLKDETLSQAKLPTGWTSLDSLLPLLARYAYWDGRHRELKTQADEADLEVKNLKSDVTFKMQVSGVPSSSPVSLTDYLALSIQQKEEALIAKVNAAFVQAVMNKKPDFLGDSTDVYSFNTPDFNHRCLGVLFNDPNAMDFVQFKTGALSPDYALSLDDVETLSIKKISKRIAAHMS